MVEEDGGRGCVESPQSYSSHPAVTEIIISTLRSFIIQKVRSDEQPYI